LADKKSLQLVSDLPDELPPIVSDAGRIQQILYNLLSNAVKFTPDGGLVELKVSQSGADYVSIAVRDTGIGIPENDLASVFEKFRQLDDSMTREHSGTGLGLAISKELVTMLGGTIHVSSELEKGSTFVVMLPIDAQLEGHTTKAHEVRLTW
jgi:signal transduction histidine kinase